MIDNNSFQKELETKIKELEKKLRAYAQIEQRLLKNEEKYRLLSENTTDTIWVMQLDGTFTYHSPAVEKLRGYTPDEANRLSMKETMTPESLAYIQRLFQEENQKPMQNRWIEKTIDLEMYHKNGSRLTVEVVVKGIRNETGHITSLQGSTRDISQRKQTENALRESKQFNEKLITSMKNGFSVLDDKGVHVMVNPAFCEMTGFSSTELVGKGPPHPYWPKHEYPTITKAFQNTLNGNFQDFELTFRRKSGDLFPVVVSPGQMTDELGRTIGFHATVKDITHLKLAEQKLLQAKQEWIDIFQAIGHATVILDTNYRILDANRAALSSIGLPMPKVIGQPCYKVFHHTHAPPAGCPLSAISLGIPSEETEIAFETIGGTFLVSCTPIYDGQGNISKIIHIATNISKRKQAENAVKFSESRYRAIVEAHEDVICRWLPDTTLTFANNNYSALFGVDPDTCIGKKWIDFIPENDRHIAVKRCAKLVGTPEKTVYEHAVTLPDGTLRWFHWIDMPIFTSSGTLVEFQSVGRDITQRKKDELRLNKHHQQLELVSQVQQMVICDTDAFIIFNTLLGGLLMITQSPWGMIGEVGDHSSAHHNLRLLASIGMGQDQNVDLVGCGGTSEGLSFTRLDTLYDQVMNTAYPVIATSPAPKLNTGTPSKDHPALDAFMGIPLKSGETLTGMVGLANRCGGYNEEMITFLRPLFSLIVTVIRFYRDRAKRDGMEKKTKELKIQLNQAQKMESIGRLAGGVAHDFNNLLSVILGYSELIMETLPTGHPDRDAVNDIHAAGIRAKALTRQLLAFARKQVLETTIVDLSDVIRGVEKMMRRLIEEDIVLDIVLPNTPLSVNADIAQIEQILINLAVNARDAMPKGGRLLIETTRVTLDHAYANEKPDVFPGTYALLSVSDTGIGMDKETAEKIFEPFFTTKEKDKGTGLGLSTVYGIVKQHKGNIWVYSEPELGTTFKIYLPVSDAPPTFPLHPEKPSFSFNDVTILLIEDDPTVRKLTHHMLSKNGFSVIDSVSPADALKKSETHKGRIDLVLTDVVMPGMIGPEVYQRIHAHHSQAKVLYMSGYPDSIIIKKGVLAQGIQFIQKPFSSHDLVEKILKAISD